MKLNKFLMGIAATALLGACSENNDTPVNPDEQVKGDGYIAVSIKLPNQPASRAVNDKYDDGTVNEYAVNTGLLILFNGTSESNATCIGTYPLDALSAWDDSQENPADNITTSYVKAVKVSGINITNNLYGMVLLNYTQVGSISDGKFVLSNGTAVNTLADMTGAASSFDFYQGSGKSANNFFMANAPLSNAIGAKTATAPTANDVFTLVNLTDDLYDTPQDAINAPAGSFYVERAVAKATLGITADEFRIDGVEVGKGVKITGTEWALVNTEPTSYFVRNLGTTDFFGVNKDGDYRMVGSVKLGTTAIQPEESLYRTYWCIDPAYNTDKVFSTVDQNTEFIGTDVPAYCNENTFDVSHMNHKNTTAAVVGITLAGGDFWTVNGDETTLYDSEAAATAYADKYIFSSLTIKNILTEAGLAPGSNITINKDVVVITWSRGDNGYLYVSNIKVNKVDGMTNDPVITEEQIKQLSKEVTELYSIAQYVGGKTYYSIRFKHFGNELTPWIAPEGISTPDADTAYGTGTTADNKYLGRFGMVRNNWYDITITGVMHLGSPEVPDLNVETPDDEQDLDKYLAVKINVLSWAKRTQSEIL